MDIEGVAEMSVWACIAGGPSLTHEDVQFCRDQGWNLATVNMGFKIAPDAKIFHAFDRLWWERYYDELKATINPDCALWSGNHWACCRHPELKRLHTRPDGGWSTVYGKAHYGETSGYQLPQIVGWENPDLIILLGYDNQYTGGKRHWHEDYPETCACPVVKGVKQHDINTCNRMKNVPNIERQVKYYAMMAAQATVPIINCSRATALTCFQRMTVQEVAEWIV